MYNKGDLKRLIDELKAKGCKVEYDRGVYTVYNRSTGSSMVLRERARAGVPTFLIRYFNCCSGYFWEAEPWDFYRAFLLKNF